MRHAITVLTILALLACVPAPAFAQDGAKKKHGKKEALLKKFDKDGDGKLSKEERAAARESMRKDGKGKGKGDGKARRKAFRHFDKDGNRKLDKSERDNFKKFRDSHRGKGGKRGRR